jgi:Ca-activated chloride channel homolog
MWFTSIFTKRSFLPLATFFGLVWFALWQASPAGGQTESTDSVRRGGAPIQVASNLVLVPVSVTNQNRQPVDNLGTQDFRITEDGRPQVIANLQDPGQSPVEIALLLDISGSVAAQFDLEQEAGARFIRSIAGPERFFTVYSISSSLQRVGKRTNDPARAIASLMSLRPTKDSTALFDSLAEAAGDLRAQASPLSRRVQVALSDGEDTFSLREGVESTLRKLHAADCIFYSINPAKPSISMNVISREGQQNLQLLAEQTGGAAFLPDNWAELPSIFAQISGDLQTQYLLAYYSTQEGRNTEYRRISVFLPGRPDLKVRARHGYYPAPLAG